MKAKLCAVLGIALVLVLVTIALTQAQEPEQRVAPQAPLGTGFTYQGRLVLSDTPVSNTCDFQFSLWDAASEGTQLGSTQSATDVELIEGTFAVELNGSGQFGASVFNGDDRWLGIGVQCRGDAERIDLGRQPLTAAPYAHYALRAPWSGVTGMPGDFADGVDSDTTYSPGTGLALDGTEFSVTSGHRLPQSCTGGQIAEWDGGLWVCGDDDGDASWSLTGNAGTVSGTHFLGTTDNQPLELRVNGARALRLEPTGTGPNVIGGHSGNEAGPAVAGASIGGGGTGDAINGVYGNYGAVGGGKGNAAYGELSTVAGGEGNAAGYLATVGGGDYNHAEGDYSVAAGGDANHAASNHAVVGGGLSNSATAGYATVGGGESNDAIASGTTIGGGRENHASGNDATVGGGYSNAASGYRSTIGGGGDILVPAFYGTVAGGHNITVTGEHATVGGGEHNLVNAMHGTIAGGHHITVTGEYASVGGGRFNAASEDGATVGGGNHNTAGGHFATVGGGQANTASGLMATVGGGNFNTASGVESTVGGGLENTAHGNFAAIGGGGENTADGWGSIIGGGGRHIASGFFSTIGGGWDNVVTATHGTIAGGEHITVTGDYATVGGGQSNIAADAWSTVGGGHLNTATGGSATIGGGTRNLVTDPLGTIAGGYGNTCGYRAAVGGGETNTASDTHATVAGGQSNTASEIYATVAGGLSNTASGAAATIPGGAANVAAGDHSFATGRRARALHDGSFVWADSTNADFDSTGNDQFRVRANGGMRMYTGENSAYFESSGGNHVDSTLVAFNIDGGSAAFVVGTGAAPVAEFDQSGTGRVLDLQNGGDIYGNGGGDFIAGYSRDNSFDLQFRIANNGQGRSDVGWTTPAEDFAEMLPAVAGLEPGDVLAIGPDGALVRATSPYQTSVAGVYSTEPGFIGGHPVEGPVVGTIPLAVVGIVPVKVTASNGAILPGDLLVSSSTPGHAMKAGPNPPQGTVIGKALEKLDTLQGSGIIKMLATLQ